jgi:hypothetical protein
MLLRVIICRSGDMLTHAYLPHGLAVRLAFTSATGDNVLTDLGMQGPKCDRSEFPATHGLHAVRGDYTEIASLDYANGCVQLPQSHHTAFMLAIRARRCFVEPLHRQESCVDIYFLTCSFSRPTFSSRAFFSVLTSR